MNYFKIHSILESLPGRKVMVVGDVVLDEYVTGAGDTVVSTLAMCLAAAADLESAVSLANTAAGIAVSKAGAVVVTIDDLQEFYSRAESVAATIGV